MWTTTQAAEAWHVSIRQVQRLCAAGKVIDSVKLGRCWMIPADTPKPIDSRYSVPTRRITRVVQVFDLSQIIYEGQMRVIAARKSSAIPRFTKAAGLVVMPFVKLPVIHVVSPTKLWIRIRAPDSAA